MFLAAVIVAVVVVAGHVAIGVFLNNRLHARGWPRPLIKLLSAASYLFICAGAALIAWWCLLVLPDLRFSESRLLAAWLVAAYAAVCCLVALGPLPWSVWRQRTYRPPAALVLNHSLVRDFSQQPGSDKLIGPGWRRWLVRLPGNEMLRIEVNQKQVVLPRLDPALDGLAIVHLSDLHFTGVIARKFFEKVVDLVNETEPDLVAVTGDLLDKTRCIDWVPYTLGRLRARHGAFFVLGNHDLRVDWRRLRETLEDSGLVDLAGKWHALTIEATGGVNGQKAPQVVLAGNELPWFPNVPDMATCPSDTGGHRPLRVLLSHSPDQIVWARKHDFDLLLAGHNHGGQIRLPVVGPVFSPSCFGVKYASGMFDEPPTLMHVSRGVSGKTPLRFNCPPELTKLVLRCPARRASQGNRQLQTLASARTNEP
jgi:predicted MPP superfamily phosphohydrolase